MARSVKITSKPKDEKSLEALGKENVKDKVSKLRKNTTGTKENKKYASMCDTNPSEGKCDETVVTSPNRKYKRRLMTNKFDLIKLLNALNSSFEKLEENTSDVKPLLIDLEGLMKHIKPTKEEEILLSFIKNVIRSRMATHNIKIALKRLGYI